MVLGSTVLEGKVLSIWVWSVSVFCSMHSARESEVSAHIGTLCAPD